MLSDFDAEGLALPRVLHARVAASADESRRSSGHREATLIQRKHRNLESFTGAPEQVAFRHLHIVHLEPAGIAGEDAPLLLHRSARKPLERPLDDECAQAGGIALALLLYARPGDHDEGVGDVRE